MKSLVETIQEARKAKEEERTTRFTFVATKKGNDWRIDFCLIPIKQMGHIVMDKNGNIEDYSGDKRRFVEMFDEYLTDFKLPKDLKDGYGYEVSRPKKGGADWNVEWKIEECENAYIDDSPLTLGRLLQR